MNSATSASTACCNNSRAPFRKTSVNRSAIGNGIPGFRYSTTLSSLMAYSSLAIRLMVLEKTHQEYATCFIRSYPTFELNSSEYDSPPMCLLHYIGGAFSHKPEE